MGFGLLESISNEKSRTFVITEKGIRFFRKMQKFIAIAQAVKIRC